MTTPPVCTFTTMHTPWPWLRQTEDGCGGMARTRFLINTEQPETQWLAVFDEPPQGFTTRVPRERRVLFITEPPEVKPYPVAYLRQFGAIVSAFPIRGVRPILHRENPCLNWHYRVKTTDGVPGSDLSSLADFRAMPMPEKTKRLSVMCSTKTYTQAQRTRIAFVEKLQARLGDAVDVYGRGRNPISDKRTAIDPYKYHLVLENNYLDNFWTEKLSDTWLGYAYPLYLGAANITAACPEGGLFALTHGDDAANLDAIERILSEDTWEKSLPAIKHCRDWVLETTNVFGRMERFILDADEKTCSLPNLDRSVPLARSGRWRTALLRRALRYGLYNPYADE